MGGPAIGYNPWLRKAQIASAQSALESWPSSIMPSPAAHFIVNGCLTRASRSAYRGKAEWIPSLLELYGLLQRKFFRLTPSLPALCMWIGIDKVIELLGLLCEYNAGLPIALRGAAETPVEEPQYQSELNSSWHGDSTTYLGSYILDWEFQVRNLWQCGNTSFSRGNYTTE